MGYSQEQIDKLPSGATVADTRSQYGTYSIYGLGYGGGEASAAGIQGKWVGGVGGRFEVFGPEHVKTSLTEGYYAKPSPTGEAIPGTVTGELPPPGQEEEYKYFGTERTYILPEQEGMVRRFDPITGQLEFVQQPVAVQRQLVQQQAQQQLLRQQVLQQQGGLAAFQRAQAYTPPGVFGEAVVSARQRAAAEQKRKSFEYARQKFEQMGRPIPPEYLYTGAPEQVAQAVGVPAAFAGGVGAILGRVPSAATGIVGGALFGGVQYGGAYVAERLLPVLEEEQIRRRDELYRAGAEALGLPYPKLEEITGVGGRAAGATTVGLAAAIAATPAIGWVTGPLYQKLTRAEILKTIPAKDQAEFKRWWDLTKGGTKDFPVRDPNLGRAQNVSTKTGQITQRYLRQHAGEGTLYGSVAEQAQLPKGVKLPLPNDVDIAASNPAQFAKGLYATLKAQGQNVRLEHHGVSWRIYETVAGKSAKAIEVHPMSALTANIETVRGLFETTGDYITQSPSGIKMLALKGQLRREAIAGVIEGSPARIERWEAIEPWFGRIGQLKMDEKGFVDISPLPAKETLKITSAPKLFEEAVLPRGGGGYYPSYPAYSSQYASLVAAAATYTPPNLKKIAEANTYPEIKAPSAAYPSYPSLPKVGVPSYTPPKPTAGVYSPPSIPKAPSYAPLGIKPSIYPPAGLPKAPAYAPPYKAPSLAPPKYPAYTPPKVPKLTVPSYKPPKIKMPTYPPYKPPKAPSYVPAYKPPKTYLPKYLPYKPPLLPPLGKFKMPKADLGKGKGYEVFAKVSGKWAKLSKVPLVKESALAVGATYVERMPAATFKLKPVGVPGVKLLGAPRFDLSKFRFPIRKGRVQPGLTFVEKTKYRIDLPGEYKGITLKGLAALRQKRATEALSLPFLRGKRRRKRRRR